MSIITIQYPNIDQYVDNNGITTTVNSRFTINFNVLFIEMVSIATRHDIQIDNDFLNEFGKYLIYRNINWEYDFEYEMKRFWEQYKLTKFNDKVQEVINGV